MKKLAHKTILLVEDNPSELSEIRSWFNETNENHDLYAVKNCREALDLLNGNKLNTPRILPDVILLNIYSPVMDGVEFLNIVKSYYSLRSIKIFFMISGFKGDEKKVSKQFNVNGIIAKPFRLNFSKEQPTSLERLKEDLKNSNGLRLQSLFMFPVSINNMFSGLSNQAKLILKSTLDFLRPIGFLNPVAITSLIISGTLITTATTISYQRNGTKPKIKGVINKVMKTEIPFIVPAPNKKITKNKDISGSNKECISYESTNKIENFQIKQDTVMSSTVKVTKKALKIVVIEEEEELYQNPSDK